MSAVQASFSAGAGSAKVAQPFQRGIGADGSYWDELALPPNVSGPITALGTCVVLRTDTDVHLWSAILRKWAVVPVSVNASVLQFNDYVTIADGTRVHAWATRTGTVETLDFPAAPTLLNGSQSSNWVSIALFGADAYGFGAFEGHWKHQALAQTNPTVSIAQLTGVVNDGAGVYGFSAYHGSFVPVTLTGAAAIAANGDVGIARSTSEVAGFSAHTNTWAVHAFTIGTQLVHERGYALYASGADLLAFSGCTGQFATHTLSSASLALTSSRYVCAVRVGGEVTSYSAGVNAFDTRAFASPSVKASDEMITVTDASGVTAFSCVRGVYSSTLAGAYTLTVREACAWAANALAGYAYSPITNAWSQAPTVGVDASVLRNAVVVHTPSGYYGYSGRDGTWTAQPSSSPTTFAAPTTGDLFLGFDGSIVYAFDPLFSRWRSVAMHAPAQQYDIWRQTAVVFDGTLAHGFALLSNAWQSVDPVGTYQTLDANDACGYALSDTHVYAYAAHGTLSTTSRWPEFSRIQPLAAPLHLHQVAPPGSQVLMLASLAGAEVPSGALGTLLVDPASLLFAQAAGVVTASGVLDTELALSGDPALHGVTLHVQNLVTRPNGTSWLTNSAAPVLF